MKQLAQLLRATHRLDHDMNSFTRTCLRDPICEIAEAARLLESAVHAHLNGHAKLAHELIRDTNLPVIR